MECTIVVEFFIFTKAYFNVDLRKGISMQAKKTLPTISAPLFRYLVWWQLIVFTSKFVRNSTDPRIRTKVEKGKVELCVSDATRADSGSYEVLLKNSEGEATAVLKVNVTGRPVPFVCIGVDNLLVLSHASHVTLYKPEMEHFLPLLSQKV